MQHSGWAFPRLKPSQWEVVSAMQISPLEYEKLSLYDKMPKAC